MLNKGMGKRRVDQYPCRTTKRAKMSFIGMIYLTFNLSLSYLIYLPSPTATLAVVSIVAATITAPTSASAIPIIPPITHNKNSSSVSTTVFTKPCTGIPIALYVKVSFYYIIY